MTWFWQNLKFSFFIENHWFRPMGPRPSRGLACPTVPKLLREGRLVVASGRMGDVKGKPSIQGLSIRTTYTLFRYRRLRQSTSNFKGSPNFLNLCMLLPLKDNSKRIQTTNIRKYQGHSNLLVFYDENIRMLFKYVFILCKVLIIWSTKINSSIFISYD